MRLDHLRLPQVVEVHDTLDAALAVDHEQGRDLPRLHDVEGEGGQLAAADEHGARGSCTRPRSGRRGRSRGAPSAAAGRRRRSCPGGARRPPSTVVRPRRLRVISKSTSFIGVFGPTRGNLVAPVHEVLHPQQLACPSLPPGCSTAKSSTVKPRLSTRAMPRASPMARAAVVEAVGARPSGQASCADRHVEVDVGGLRPGSSAGCRSGRGAARRGA